MVNPLPIVLISGVKYFKDERLQEFRQVGNPHQRISFDDIGTKKAIPVKTKHEGHKQRRKL